MAAVDGESQGRVKSSSAPIFILGRWPPFLLLKYEERVSAPEEKLAIVDPEIHL